MMTLIYFLVPHLPLNMLKYILVLNTIEWDTSHSTRKETSFILLQPPSVRENLYEISPASSAEQIENNATSNQQRNKRATFSERFSHLYSHLVHKQQVEEKKTPKRRKKCCSTCTKILLVLLLLFALVGGFGWFSTY